MRGHPKNSDAHQDDLGILLSAALTLDRSWTSRAMCHQWRYDDDPANDNPRPSPWHATRDTRIEIGGVEVSGHEMTRVALLYCFACPVQWDCARFAVEGLCKAGTWAMRIVALNRLQDDIPGALAMLHEAEDAGVPVQVAVARHLRTVDADAPAT